jgi:hypothetical protein
MLLLEGLGTNKFLVTLGQYVLLSSWNLILGSNSASPNPRVLDACCGQAHGLHDSFDPGGFPWRETPAHG